MAIPEDVAQGNGHDGGRYRGMRSDSLSTRAPYSPPPAAFCGTAGRIEIPAAQKKTELALPPVKIHCSVLAEDAIKAAIADYMGKREKTQ